MCQNISLPNIMKYNPKENKLEKTMNEIVSFDNVSFTYQSEQGETSALKNINFTVNEGEFVAIVGPSGCGKTTILSLISGILLPSSGKIIVDGATASSRSGLTGYMFQHDLLFNWRNIYKNVTLGLEIKKNKDKSRYKYASDLLKKYGLEDFKKSFPSELSGGMRQRVALIRTLALNPKVLLLDEPFSALDFQTRLNVCEDVKRILVQEKKTAILVTHDISEAISLSDKVIVLTKRPAVIKNVYDINFNNEKSPLKRRENSAFASVFDKIWKEIQTDENKE